jgi:hypothetical protein
MNSFAVSTQVLLDGIYQRVYTGGCFQGGGAESLVVVVARGLQAQLLAELPAGEADDDLAVDHGGGGGLGVQA